MKITREILLATVLFGMFCTPVAHAQGPSTSAADLVKSLGFSLIDAEAVDFQLPDLAGNNKTLSSFKGRWIWLTFWATWCGPCRHELPALESLYQELKSKGLEVVAVSVDQGAKAQVEKLVKDLELTFTVLLDEQGRVGGSYQASALPTIYLISPDWRLVGLVRGAVNWEHPSVLATAGKLMEFPGIPAEGLQNAGKAGVKEGGLSLPEELQPPAMNLASVDDASTGKTTGVDVRIDWKGESQKYLIKVPKVTVPDGVTIGAVSSSSSSATGRSILTYHFPLGFPEIGTYQVGPVELSYQPRAGGSEQFARLPGIQVDIKGRAWWRWIAVAAALAGLAVIGVVIGYKLKSRGQKGKFGEDDKFSRWRHQYQDLRKVKLSGDRARYSADLMKLSYDLRKNRNTAVTDLDHLMEKVKYGGESLSDAQLKVFEKEIERELSI